MLSLQLVLQESPAPLSSRVLNTTISHCLWHVSQSALRGRGKMLTRQLPWCKFFHRNQFQVINSFTFAPQNQHKLTPGHEIYDWINSKTTRQVTLINLMLQKTWNLREMNSVVSKIPQLISGQVEIWAQVCLNPQSTHSTNKFRSKILFYTEKDETNENLLNQSTLLNASFLSLHYKYRSPQECVMRQAKDPPIDNGPIFNWASGKVGYIFPSLPCLCWVVLLQQSKGHEKSVIRKCEASWYCSLHTD